MKTGYPSIDKTHLQGIPEEKLHPEILPASMFATFLKINEGHLDEVAVEADGEVYTKQTLKDDAVKFAGLLLKKGIKAGDKLVVVVPNSYEGIAAIFGANAIGVPVAITHAVDEADLSPFYEELDLHRPKAVLLYSGSTTLVDAIKEYAESVELVLIVKPDENASCYEFRAVLDGTEISLPETSAEIEKHSLSEKDEAAFYLKTSGSSAKPKTLPFSNYAILAALMYILNSSKTDARDARIKKALCQASYYHGYGWMAVFMNIIAGNTVSLVGAAPEDIAGYYEFKPSIIYGSPLTLRQFMELTPEDADLSSITAFYCAGAVLHEKDYKDGIKYFRTHGCQAEIHNNYGISEGMCIGTVNDHNAHVPGTSGKFYIGPEWLIVDEDGNEVKYDEVGELIVSSASLCQGYLGDEELTKKCFIKRDGKTFFKTGDAVSLREDGYVTFIGRERRFFIAEGIFEKVNCETIEEVISTLPYVYQNAVIVTPDETSCRAFIALKNDVAPDEAKREIEGAMAKILQAYEMPKEIVYLDKIPLMNSGKINYKLLETM
ncbi:acyl--CoA ligase [Candidatus Saccharibacteria bacterium]|nr:acyl--CoA ligase [Candidatus Saccharibacteria bacterium]